MVTYKRDDDNNSALERKNNWMDDTGKLKKKRIGEYKCLFWPVWQWTKVVGKENEITMSGRKGEGGKILKPMANRGQTQVSMYK